MAKIVALAKEGKKQGFKIGDELVSFDGYPFCDILDCLFYDSKEKFSVVVKRNGKEKTIKVKKKADVPLGIEIDKELSPVRCKNKCKFCFVDQLPKGMRDTLYFKDDDSRLSFLFGNYVTLTNLTEHEIERIIKMHISPMNISIHTTNPELRCKMMNNRFAGESLEIVKRFAKAGIVINTQLVICPGINDGEELERSLKDLTELGVNAVAVVPVGLTDHREGLYPLTPFNKESAGEVLDICEKYGDECVKKFSRRIIFAADELYIKAERKLPEADYYEDFSCLENGVGLIPLLRDEFEFALEYLEADSNLKRQKTIACGVSVAPYLSGLCEKLREKFPNVSVNIIPIVNDFFGHQINVTGLIVGRDLISQLKDKELGEEVLISCSMLRSGEEVFLDDVTVSEVSEILGVPVTPNDNSGEGFLNSILK